MATKRKVVSRKSATRLKAQRRTIRSSTPKKSTKPKYVYYFGDGHADGTGKMKPLLGGKGANLAEMTRIGLPVPPGFTITTDVCSYFYAHNRRYPPQLKAEVEAALAKVEKSVGKKLGHKERTGKSFPQDPKEQMWGSISAVFGSWMNDRAIVYRRKYGIPHDWGTAVNVQTMVFGNMGETSATGVAFTRDPASGEKVFYGEYLINAQGEDVVAGVRTPHPIAHLAKEMPAAHKALMKVRELLERHFEDMQDLEFTVEENRLYILQTRNGKRTGHAAVRIAVDMVGEKLISKKDAVRRIPADSLAHLLAPIFDRQSAKQARKIGSGLAAGPGAASGHVVFSAEEAVARSAKGQKVVLARIETSPEDLRGMIAAEGILTSRGGVSSHAALVARQMGKVCVCGASGIQIDYQKRTLSANG